MRKETGPEVLRVAVSTPDGAGGRPKTSAMTPVIDLRR